jgi:ankyrin repeat protein
LLAKNCDIEAKNERGNTPLLLAASMSRHAKTLRILLKNKANVNALNDHRGYDFVQCAAMNTFDNVDIFDLALQVFEKVNNKAFDFNKIDGDGDTVLNAARFFYNTAIAQRISEEMNKRENAKKQVQQKNEEEKYRKEKQNEQKRVQQEQAPLLEEERAWLKAQEKQARLEAQQEQARLKEQQEQARLEEQEKQARLKEQQEQQEQARLKEQEKQAVHKMISDLVMEAAKRAQAIVQQKEEEKSRQEKQARLEAQQEQAAQKENEKKRLEVQLMMDKRADIPVQDPKKSQILYDAAQKGTTKVVKAFLDEKHVLYHCLRYGHIAVTNLMIENGEIKKEDDATMFWAASDENNLAILPKLVGALTKLDISIYDAVNYKNEDGKTPIMMAARSGSIELLNKLICLGARLDVTDNAGATLLHYAAGNELDNPWMVRHVIQSGMLVDLNQTANGMTALGVARAGNKPNIVRYLMALAQNINAVPG